MGELLLDNIRAVSIKEAEANKGDGNYYRNDEALEATRNDTKKTPAWDIVRAQVKDTGASARDLSSKDMLAKWTESSGFKKILGSPMEKAFVGVNSDDFVKTGTAKRDGKEYDVFSFDKTKSDRKVILPSCEKDTDGTIYYAINGQAYTPDGQEYTPKGNVDLPKLEQPFLTEHYGS